MKKNFIFIMIFILSSILLFSGCNKGNEEINNDGNEEAANIYDDPSYEREGIGYILNVPKGCYAELNTGNSSLNKLVIDDSEIYVPETDSVVIETFTPLTMDVDDKKNFVEALLEKDEGIYIYDSSARIKREVEADLEYYEELSKNALASGDESYASYIEEHFILSLKQELLNAPREYQLAEDYSGNEYIGVYQGIEYQLSIFSSLDETYSDKMGFFFSYHQTTDNLIKRNYKNADYASLTTTTNIDLDDEDFENQSEMSASEAEQIATDFLSQFQITDLVVSECNNLIWEYGNTTGEVLAYEADGYIFSFLRSINLVPVYSGNISNVDNLVLNNGYITIPQEEYTVIVYDGEILSATGYQVTASVDAVDTDINLLSFDEILNELGIEACKYYEKYPTMYNKVEFNDVRLTYYPIYGNDSYEYIPVWLFIEYDETTGSVRAPYQFMVVNAIDGSIIDIIEEAKEMGLYTEE